MATKKASARPATQRRGAKDKIAGEIQSAVDTPDVPAGSVTSTKRRGAARSKAAAGASADGATETGAEKPRTRRRGSKPEAGAAKSAVESSGAVVAKPSAGQDVKKTDDAVVIRFAPVLPPRPARQTPVAPSPAPASPTPAPVAAREVPAPAAPPPPIVPIQREARSAPPPRSEAPAPPTHRTIEPPPVTAREREAPRPPTVQPHGDRDRQDQAPAGDGRWERPGEGENGEGGGRRRRRRRRRRRGGGDREQEHRGGAAAPQPVGDTADEDTDAPEQSLAERFDEGSEAGVWGEDGVALEDDDRSVAESTDSLDDLLPGSDGLDESLPDARAELEGAPEMPDGRGDPERGRGRRRRRPRFQRSDNGVDAAARTLEPEQLTEVDGTEPTLPTGARKEMIVNVVPGEECRIAILENGKLEEIYLERASAENHVGSIYKGVVTNVEPSIQAAFIDFGLGKNGFLHISDLHPQYFPNGDRHTENVGRKLPRRHRPPIQACLRRGQEVLVQITKEGIGTKGPTLTTYLSIPGRFLVMMPGMRQLGVSRKVEDEQQRHTLRDLLNELTLPEDMGFIARTAAVGRNQKELQSDLNYLSRLWKSVKKRIERDRAPAELYRESELVIRTIRDIYSSDVEKIIVDNVEVAERAREFLTIFNPRAGDVIVQYSDPEPIFHRHGIEAELERLHSRHVPLRSGGSLVIDQTEALVAIDVNSGRFRTEDDAETTAFKINQEAADEVPRQLRLRDLGGVIICDFIDMRGEAHRREIERRLVANLKKHKERAKVLRMSAFGIIEMTRQRQRASLTRSVYQDCHFCRGTGLVKTSESVALDVMRSIQLVMTHEHIRSIELTVSSEVAYLLQNRKRAVLADFERRYSRHISIKADAGYGLDRVEAVCTDVRGRLVPHP